MSLGDRRRDHAPHAVSGDDRMNETERLTDPGHVIGEPVDGVLLLRGVAAAMA